jgi:hypothetical protein
MDKPEPKLRMNDGYSIDDDVKFKRYLVGEMLWELAQHEPVPSMFAGVSRESVEVLIYCGYDDLRVRIKGAVFDVHLSWKKAVPPTIKRL